VIVTVNHRGGLHRPNVVAVRYYRSPFNDPVPIVAIRSGRSCTPVHDRTSGP
jgi:hypothetical protein